MTPTPDYLQAVLLFLMGLLIQIIVAGLQDEITEVPLLRNLINPVLTVLAVIATVFIWFLAYLAAFPPV